MLSWFPFLIKMTGYDRNGGEKMHSLYNEIVNPWKDVKINAMYETLEQLDPHFKRSNERFPKTWEFPLLKYVFTLCLHSAKIKDIAAIQQALQFWEHVRLQRNGIFHYEDSSWLLLDKQYCKTRPPFNKESTKDIILLTKKALDQGFQGVTPMYLERSWQSIKDTQFLPLVEEAGSVIVHLEYQINDDDLTAYTTQFQGITYTDWSDNPLSYAESIVHESAHSLLNYYIEALDLKIPSTTYWSPWRQTNRPAYGVLHGVWAFSHVYQFYKRLAVAENREEHLIRAEREKKDLIGVGDSLAAILDDIGSDQLQELVRDVYPFDK
ncbi:aKG-HExxH-type peptide beta-hydroxylase [Shimazuella alba]|uniref:HEXXH motif-containing protein n=1 Tax=Shimazuella alba TaxID=2690964 RepID=A0A6I4W0T2_9BACL|nr:HEXXH motif-containing putative peptide modification protein [Shimazuella alba]MXQ54284.1 hypothetical protein [Shimazuella alba]